MAITKFVSGVNTSFSTELNANANASLLSSHQALVEDVRSKEDQGKTPKADPPTIKRDFFSDSTGYLDTIDTVNTTAPYDSGDESYGPISEGTADAYDHTQNGSNTVSSITTTCTAAVELIINEVKVKSAGGSGLFNCTVDIKNSGGTTVATLTQDVANNALVSFTFNEGDYSSNIAAGTFSVVITKNSGVGVMQDGSGNSFSGDLFSFSSQTVCSTGGGSGVDWFVAEATTDAATIIQTNPLFISKAGSTVQTYDAPAHSTNTFNDITCVANEDIFITRLKFTRTVAGASNIVIKDASLNDLYNVVPPSSTNVDHILLPADYTRPILSGETFVIRVNTTIRTAPTQSTTGTLFDFTSQSVMSDYSGFDGIIEASSVSGGDIGSGFLYVQREDSDSNPVTYDVSTDNGSSFPDTGLTVDEVNNYTANGGIVIYKINIPAGAKAYGLATTLGGQ